MSAGKSFEHKMNPSLRHTYLDLASLVTCQKRTSPSLAVFNNGSSNKLDRLRGNYAFVLLLQRLGDGRRNDGRGEGHRHGAEKDLGKLHFVSFVVKGFFLLRKTQRSASSRIWTGREIDSVKRCIKRLFLRRLEDDGEGRYDSEEIWSTEPSVPVLYSLFHFARVYGFQPRFATLGRLYKQVAVGNLSPSRVCLWPPR